MRRFVIDTDTGSDDAIAIIMMLREPSAEVVAVTTVCGNVPLDLATRNAIISIEQAGTYRPPVYEGCSRPIVKPYKSAQHVHGVDGLGDQGYEPSGALVKEEEHAVDALIRLARERDDLELITLGPLTNVALAITRDPEAMARYRKIYIMGGAKITTTATAEYNILTDPEAADIVWRLGVPLVVCPIDICMGDAIVTAGEAAKIKATGPLGAFMVDCNATLMAMIEKVLGAPGISMPDPTTTAVALYPDCVAEATECHSYVDTRGKYTYGQTVFDFMDILKKPKNVTLIDRLHADRFKQIIYRTAGAKEE